MMPFHQFQMIVQRQAMRLEMLGMKHSSGKSVVAHVKKLYGLKGKPDKVLEQFEVIMRNQGLIAQP